MLIIKDFSRYDKDYSNMIFKMKSYIISQSTIKQVREEEARTMTIRRGSPHFHRHYSLKKTVDVEGNDYEHIWQSQPKPSATQSQPVSPKAPKELQLMNNNTLPLNNSKEHKNSHKDTAMDSCMSASSSRGSSFKGGGGENNNMSDNSIKSKPYYVTSKDILSSGNAKENYGGTDQTKAVLQTFMDTKTTADIADL